MAGVDTAERALELADEAIARADVEDAVAHLSGAIRGFTAADDKRRAAMACVRLGDTLANAMGNLTASRAWFARARRLVETEPPCLEQGWVAVAAMGCDVDDPAELQAAAELALDRARRFGDVNLETKALADAGLAHVQAGRVSEGMALLDEAMALACGPADDTPTPAKSVCSFFTACYFAADFDRAGSWTDLLRRHGLISLAAGPTVFLSSHCDSVQATLLVELGRWTEAEGVLTRAKASFEAAMHMPSWHPDIALADLRVRQGRLAEAEALLLGKDQAVQALLPAARLHLARGDHDLACAAALRGLGSSATIACGRSSC
jgi:tetratricopeptide (TPR) repeat protein